MAGSRFDVEGQPASDYPRAWFGVTFLFVSIGLPVIAAAACYLPASRALEVDAVEALRVE